MKKAKEKLYLNFYLKDLQKIIEYFSKKATKQWVICYTSWKILKSQLRVFLNLTKHKAPLILL